MDGKAIFSLSALCCATTLLTGCFHLDTGKFVRSDEEHVLVNNYGWYLFHVIPLACGNANENRWFPWVMFRNDVTMEKIQGRFMRYADGRPIHDLAYTSSDSVMLEIPGINFTIPVPYLLTYRELQLSGTLGSKSEDPETEDPQEADCFEPAYPEEGDPE